MMASWVMTGYNFTALYMSYHWQNKTIEFSVDGAAVKIQAILHTALAISESPLTQVQKWDKGNDIWAYALVTMEPATPPDPIPDSVIQLL